MSRPAAVTAAAVVAILGSLITAFFAVTMVIVTVSPVFQPPTAPHPLPGWYKWVGAAMGLFFAGMAAWGIATAVGLLRLRNWARVSILVFAALLAAMSAMMVASTLAFTPPPPSLPPTSVASFRIFMGVMYAIPILISAWWLIQFTRPGTRAAFDLADPSTDDGGRPLSMGIIGWMMVIGGVGCLVPVAIGFPGFVAGGVVTGGVARLWYAALGAAELYGGAGLLRLRERGRWVAMVVLCLGFVNALMMLLRPGAYEKAVTAQRAQLPQLPQLPASATVMGPHQAAMLSVWIGVATLVPLWFLIRRRAAFRPATA